MDNQGRQVLFIVLSILILFTWMYFAPQPPAPLENASSSSTLTPQPGTSPASSTASIPAIGIKKAHSIHVPSSVPAKEVTIETDDYIATFSNKGAVLTDFQLKKYLNRASKKFSELVNPDPERPKPFSLNYPPLQDVNTRIFEVEGSSKKLSKAEPQAKLVFRTVDENGTALEKTFDFKNGSYAMDFSLIVSQTGKNALPAVPLAVEWSDTLGVEENTGTQSRGGGYRVATWMGDHVSSEGVKQKSKETVEIPPPIGWTALANQYFVAALIPDPSSGGVTVKVLRDFNAYNSPTPENPDPGVNPKAFTPRPILIFTGQELKAGESFERKGQVYLGPQDYSLLKNLNIHLEDVINFGMFRLLCVPMLELLRWFYSWVHNWGLAIILLSLLVKLLLWWPTSRSIRHMNEMGKKMREIQPQLEALKKKHADDRQKLNQETMLLHQKAGINPLQGCLPQFLQMPVWIALYSTLSQSIELRGSSFVFWIKDLSLMDPFYILPIFMGGSMLITQWMTSQHSPQATSAGQQKFMLWFMPIVFTMMLSKTPSGLQLYILLSNILSMIQSKLVYRAMERRS